MKALKIISRGKHTIIRKRGTKKYDKLICIPGDIIPFDEVKAREKKRYEVVDVDQSEIKDVPEINDKEDLDRRGPGRPRKEVNGSASALAG